MSRRHGRNARELVASLIGRDGTLCGICKLELAELPDLLQYYAGNPRHLKRTRIDIDVDHRNPKSQSKDNTFDNLQLAHRTCNNAKGSYYP